MAKSLFVKFTLFCKEYFGGTMPGSLEFILDQFWQVLQFRKGGYKLLTGDCHAVALAWISTMERVRNPILHLTPLAHEQFVEWGPRSIHRMPGVYHSHFARSAVSSELTLIPVGFRRPRLSRGQS